jgi:FkbM family methyltransferase
MKAIIQRFLALFGVRVIRAKNARKYLPRPNIDNIEIITRFYSLQNKKITLLQVGACDGVTSDSVHPYIKAGGINAYLVEPSTVNFNKLSQFYAGVPNATLIHAAVADKDEKRNFYTIKDEGRWKDSGAARQIASFYKKHVSKHANESEIEVENVNCMTLKSIIDKYNIRDLEAIVIDTEGYDGEIVRMALDQNIKPNFIAFENVQLVKNYQQSELDSLYSLLAQHGYVWTHDRINTLAVRKDFLLH